MKDNHTIEHEIEIVEMIIDQLKQCLAIFKISENHDSYQETLKDIEKCQTELQKLILEKDTAKDVQGETRNGPSQK